MELAHNTEAEQGVLGTMLEHQTTIPDVMGLIESKDFYRPVHQQIFTIITRLYEDKVPICPITVRDICKKEDVLNNEDSDKYICETLVDLSGVTPFYGVHYAKMVKTESQRRQQQELGLRLTEAASKAGSDPDKISEILVRELSAIKTSKASGEIDAYKMMECYWERFNKRKENSSASLYSSGIPTLDKDFSRLGEAQFIVIKGRRGSGKTHWMIHLSTKCYNHGRTAVIFTYEMSKYQLLDRYIANIASMDSREIISGSDNGITAVSFAAAEFTNYSLKIIETSGSVADMRMYCNALVNQKCDIGFIGVDYAELVRCNKGHNREQELGYMAKELKDLAVEFNTSVVCLSQTNKEGAERGSEGIGNVSDLLLFWKHDEKILKAEKNRFGPGFTIQCGVDLSTSTLWEERR